MDQLPLFLNIRGRKVMLWGEGEAAEAKRRLIERAGGICVGIDDSEAKIGFVALEGDGAAETAAALKTRGLLVNVVDRPELCDFTTPSIVDRNPVLIAVGTGGASAGLAKAVRQRIELLLPQSLGALATALHQARTAIRARWPEANDRRRALDAAMAAKAPLDPLHADSEAVTAWLTNGESGTGSQLVHIDLTSNDPDDLTLRAARLLGEADHIFHDDGLADSILARARADAVRHLGEPPAPPPPGLTLYLRLRA